MIPMLKKRKEKERTMFKQLPDSLLAYIFLFLELPDISNIGK